MFSDNRGGEVPAKKQAEGSTELDWDAEREEILQELIAAAAEVQSIAPTNGDAQ